MIGASVPAVPGASRQADDMLKIVVMGTLEERKGQDLAIKAYAMLSTSVRAGASIDFYGRVLGRDRAYADRIIKAINDVPGLRYGDALEPGAAAVVIGAADAVLIPSRDEPLSLVAVEAMSAGKIVICSTACGISDHLTDGVTGYIADEATASVFAAAIERAAADRSRWTAIGEAARKVYHDQFSPEIFHRAVRERLEAELR